MWLEMQERSSVALTLVPCHANTSSLDCWNTLQVTISWVVRHHIRRRTYHCMLKLSENFTQLIRFHPEDGITPDARAVLYRTGMH